MPDPRPDARIPCPQCGAQIHPIAGRCKHCKADLGALRGARPQAAATLPALVASTGVPTFGTDAVSEPVLPPRVSMRMPAVAPAAPRWPLIVIGISALAVVMAVIAMVMPSGGEPTKPAHRALDADEPDRALERPSMVTPPRRPPASTDDVRPPVASDLATYTRSIGAYGNPHANIVTTQGRIRCELFADKAPRAVANFVGLATGKKPWTHPATGSIERNRPFYDGLTFHRAIEGFMIQGGDPLGTGLGGPGYTFDNEIDPDLKMEPGTLAMANAGPGTNGSQFFITENAPSWLDGKHTIFGKCEGLETVRAIARLPQNTGNKPDTPVTMTIEITR